MITNWPDKLKGFTGLLYLPVYIFQEKPGDKTEWG